jgi:hypothetical protein
MWNNNDDSFNLTRQTLNAKQKVLKQKGKGNKPKRSQPITDNEINMYEKGLLEDSSPESLLSTVWMNNCIQLGLRGVSEHYNLRFVILPNFILQILSPLQTPLHFGQNKLT